MSKFWNWIDKGHNKGAYDLMTNQIYTAVLGSIIYMLFDWCYTIYTNNNFTHDTTLRTLFLFLIVAFYLADFYYIKGSNPYRKWHFVFDIVFMICMLYSVKLLNVDTKDIKELPITNFINVKFNYILFLFLYLIWDIREIVDAYNKNITQKGYYLEVILWEVISLILLWFFCKDSLKWLLIVLSFSTVWFCFLSYRKSEHQSFTSWIKSFS